MRPSPLQLFKSRILEFELKARPQFDSDQENPEVFVRDLQAALQVERLAEDDDAPDLSNWTILLVLSMKADAEVHTPYDFLIAIAGDFVCKNDLPGALSQEDLVGVNGTSMLYGIAREAIQTLTEKSLWGSLTLPTMSFTDYRDMIAAQLADDALHDYEEPE